LVGLEREVKTGMQGSAIVLHRNKKKRRRGGGDWKRPSPRNLGKERGLENCLESTIRRGWERGGVKGKGAIRKKNTGQCKPGDYQNYKS